MFLTGAKLIAAGLATISLAGAGAGIGTVFAGYMTSVSRNPSLLKKLYNYIYFFFKSKRLYLLCVSCITLGGCVSSLGTPEVLGFIVEYSNVIYKIKLYSSRGVNLIPIENSGELGKILFLLEEARVISAYENFESFSLVYTGEMHGYRGSHLDILKNPDVLQFVVEYLNVKHKLNLARIHGTGLIALPNTQHSYQILFHLGEQKLITGYETFKGFVLVSLPAEFVI